jgi:PAS domain S-box-containing protein
MHWLLRTRSGRTWLLLSALALAVGLIGTTLFQRSREAKKIYKIGFIEAPPFMTRSATGELGGFAHEALTEAARRSNIHLQWVFCGQDGVNAVQSGQVDLWPLAVDWPERRGTTHFTDPWLQTELHILVHKKGSVPDRVYTGPIAHKDSPVFLRQRQECFPAAQSVKVQDYREGVQKLLEGRAQGLLFTTWDNEIMEQLLAEMDPRGTLRECPVPGRILQHVLVSSYKNQAVADRLRKELDNMAREGTLAAMLGRYSWRGIAMLQTTYQLLEARQRARWLGWIASGLLLGVLGLAALSWVLHRTRDQVISSETARAELLERYTLAAQATSDAIWDWNPRTGRLVWSEGLKLVSGFEPSEIPQDVRWRMTHIHPEDRNRISASLQAAFDSHAPKWTGEYRFITKDGSSAFVVDRGHIVFSPQGAPLRMLGAITDMTFRRNLETQLRLAQKMEAVGRLAGGVAHDFNNLLTVLRGYTDLLQDELPEASSSSKHANQISRVVDRATELVHQLLAFGRRQIVEPKLIDVNLLLREMEPLIQRLMGEDITLSLHLSPMPGKTLADPGQLHQVLMNLVVNARDAMPEGGRIIIETALVEIDETHASIHPGMSPGPHLLLALTDTGTGMNTEVLSRIFEPFFTTKEQGKGTGLGLSTVYGIIHQCHGHISAYSEPGIGTTFKIHLPRMESLEHSQEAPSPRRQGAAPKGTERILVAEDQDDVRILTVKILEHQGYLVSTAGTAEAVRLLAETTPEPFDLLLTDVIMPGMNGKDLAGHIQARWPSIKVLFMSGYSEDLIEHRGVLNPGIAFLPKPFTRDALLQKIREVLEETS